MKRHIIAATRYTIPNHKNRHTLSSRVILFISSRHNNCVDRLIDLKGIIQSLSLQGNVFCDILSMESKSDLEGMK